MNTNFVKYVTRTYHPTNISVNDWPATCMHLRIYVLLLKQWKNEPSCHKQLINIYNQSTFQYSHLFINKV